MPDIDTEIQLFEQETADIVEFSQSILGYLPEDSVHRLDAARTIQQAIDRVCDEFVAGASDLLTLGCEKCIREAADQIDPILHVRALRCAASEKLWRTCLAEMQGFCSDGERSEIAAALTDTSYQDAFASYSETYLQCKQAVYSTFAQTTNLLKESMQITEKAEKNDIGGEQVSRLINSLDNKLIAAASRCDELLDDIYLIQQKTAQNADAASLRFNASTCKQRSLKPKVNPKLLTLKQTITLINEFWDAKAKSDVSCRKQGRSSDTARQFLASFYACKIGVGNTQSKYPKQLAYSAGYYAKQSAICAIFCAEVYGDIDEAFKLMCLEYEKRVSKIAFLYLKKLCEEKTVAKMQLTKEQMHEVAARAYQITGIDSEQIVDDLYTSRQTANLHDFLNVIDLKSLQIHKSKLLRLSEAFKFYDVRKIQRLNRENFVQLIKENFPQCDGERLFDQASQGHKDITFSQAVFVLGPVILCDSSQTQGDNQAPSVQIAPELVQESGGLRINDLK